MARKKRGGMLGFDPLAWMKEGSGSAGTPSPESPEPPAADAAKPQRMDALPAVPKDAKPQAPLPSSPPAAPAAARPAAAPDETFTVDLGESLTIERVGDVHARLRRATARRVVLAAQSLRSVDTAGIQLLGAFVSDAAQRGTAVEWRTPHAIVYQAAQQLGLQALLRLP